MMWQAKLKAWAVGLGLAAATLGGTGYLATTGVGQGPLVPAAGRPGVPGVPPMPPGSTSEDATKLEIEVLEARVKESQQQLKAAQERLAALKKPVVTAMLKTAELRRLREQQVEVLTLGVKNLHDRHQGEKFSDPKSSLYIDLSGKLAQAEMVLATTNEQQTAFWTNHRDRMKEFRVEFEARAKSGTVSQADLFHTRAAELAAEIKLLELGAK